MENREQKQNYLRNNILANNYDASEFVYFLNTKIPIGDNLDLCTFEELKAVVQQFIAQKEQEEHELDNFEPLGSDIVQSAVEIPSEEKKIIKPKAILFTKTTPNVVEPEFEKSFQCKKIYDKYNHLATIKCTVTDAQRKNMGGVFGIGSTSFLEFRVQTLELNWNVGRRYSDFTWLRNYLITAYPTYIIPPVPEKKASKKTQRHIQKRMLILQYFLNDLVTMRQILNDKYVEGFLSLTDHAKFEALKKQTAKIKPIDSFSQYVNFEGIVESKLTEENKVFLEEIEKKTAEFQRHYKEITRFSKSLQNTMCQQVNTLYSMGNKFAELHESTRQSLNKIPKCESLRRLNDIYITLNNMMIEWGNLVRNQHQLLEVNFNTFFKYVRNELYGFSELVSREAQIENEYTKTKIALEKKKEKIYNMHDPNKWELSSKQLATLPKQLMHDKAESFKVMLPQDNLNLEKLRTKLFFYINQMHLHGQQDFKRTGDKFCENFKEFAIKNKVNTQQLGEMWLEMSANFSGPNTKPQFVKEIPIQQSNQNDQMYDD